jgi:hypothetical protein
MEKSGRVRFYMGDDSDDMGDDMGDDSSKYINYHTHKKNKINYHFYLSIISMGLSITSLIISITNYYNCIL